MANSFLENKKKLSCIVYAMNIVKLLTVDNQENIKIYNLINNFFTNEENVLIMIWSSGRDNAIVKNNILIQMKVSLFAFLQK